jgi:hypothetical protein
LSAAIKNPNVPNGLKDLPSESGAYLIVNVRTGGRYAGQSGNIRVRCHSHYNQLRMGCHPNYKMNRDAVVHGADSFIFVSVPHLMEYQVMRAYGTTDLHAGYNLEDIHGLLPETSYRLVELRLVNRKRFHYLDGAAFESPVDPIYLESWWRTHRGNRKRRV